MEVLTLLVPACGDCFHSMHGNPSDTMNQGKSYFSFSYFCQVFSPRNIEVNHTRIKSGWQPWGHTGGETGSGSQPVLAMPPGAKLDLGPGTRYMVGSWF